jgi:hypothetical protein
MLQLAIIIFAHHGIGEIYNYDTCDDPTTEEEFNRIKYDNSSKTITWEDYQSAAPIHLQKNGIKRLRFIRNKDLQASDWIMTVDNKMTIQNFQEFIDYRQRLRDFISESTTILWKKFPNELDLDAMNYPKLPTIIRKQ